MTTTDWIILALMGAAAGVALVAFALLTRYLFDRGLADPDAAAPNIVDFYKRFIQHTRKETGRIGGAFWVHTIAAGVFITTGVVYTIARFVLPRFF